MDTRTVSIELSWHRASVLLPLACNVAAVDAADKDLFMLADALADLRLEVERQVGAALINCAPAPVAESPTKRGFLSWLKSL